MPLFTSRGLGLFVSKIWSCLHHWYSRMVQMHRQHSDGLRGQWTEATGSTAVLPTGAVEIWCRGSDVHKRISVLVGLSCRRFSLHQRWQIYHQWTEAGYAEECQPLWAPHRGWRWPMALYRFGSHQRMRAEQGRDTWQAAAGRRCITR